jgi:Na+-transporting NADH:ubiquinone oxidoreductase subunit A
MSKDIRIKNGLSISLVGTAEQQVSDAPKSKIFTINPPEFAGITPKLVAKEGTKVLAGDVLFYSKADERMKFVSPVSGVVKEIVRGERRKVLSIIIEADDTISYKDFGKTDLKNTSREDVLNQLLASGSWAFFNQKPYEIIANPNETPRAIFISSFDTAPLAQDYGFSLKDEVKAIQAAIDVLAKLTFGKVYVGLQAGQTSVFEQLENVEKYKVSGVHPAGNVGVQINKLSPINKGERIWTIKPADLVIIGKVFTEGKFIAERTIALAGSEVDKPQYYKTTIGADLSALINANVSNENVRVISGNVLTGTNITANKTLTYTDNTVTIIPEGDKHRFFGWMPWLTGNNRFSMSRTNLSFLMPKKKYVLDTNLNGEERALVVTGEMEKVMPMDIYPMQLIKAILIDDIDKMELLGIYEVAPEDFALIDFTNTSKLEAQNIVRYGLDLMVKEVG